MTGPLGGPPRGNTNAMRHGARSKRRTFPLSGLGRKYVTINQFAAGLRRRLEAEVSKARGVLTIADEADISTACSWEVTRQIALRRVAEGTSTDILADSKTSSYAAEQRNKAIRKLGLEDERRSTPSAWDEVDAILQAEANQEADGGADTSDDAEHDPEGDRPRDGDVEGQAGDGEGDDENADVWREVDEEIDRQRAEDGG